MFGTRSPFPKAQVTNATALLVSHGQPSDPDVAEAELAAYARPVRQALPDWSVLTATLAKPDALEAVAGELGASPIVFPIFMTDGWFTRDVLPKRLAGLPDARPILLDPLGTNPMLSAIAARWVDSIISEEGWDHDETCLVIASHGSGRSRQPAKDTFSFADAVRTQLPLSEVRIGFVEETPSLEEALADAPPQSICLPFFATARGHVLDDLPRAYAASGFRGVRLDPIGMHAHVPVMIASALASAVTEATHP